MLGWKNKVIHGFCLLTFLSYILYFFNISDIFHLWSSSHSLCVAQAAVGGRARKPFYCKSSREAASKIQVVFFHNFCKTFHQMQILKAGLHNLCHPTIGDGSTWSKFRARGEHREIFLFSNLDTLWFLENLIRYSLHVCIREVKNNLFSFRHSYLRNFSWGF